MRRWGWLGLVGLMACSGAEDPSFDTQVGPDCTSASGQARPSEGLASPGESEASSSAAREGREAVLIRYRRSVSGAAARPDAVEAVLRTGGQLTARWERLGALAARLSPEERAALASAPDVLAIEPDVQVYAFGRLPPVTSGSVGEYTEALRLVQASEVWDANGDGILDDGAPIGSGIRVCVIDSGWDGRHPELKAAYAGGKDFVDGDDDPLDFDNASGKWGSGHGTHTAAIIAAQLGSAGAVSPGDDLQGMVGVAPGVELLVARVLDIQGRGNASSIISALEWCRQQGAHIVSLSLGTPEPSSIVEAAFNDALAAGMLSIAATGNSGTGNPASEPGVSYPAAYDSVLAVGAVDFAKERPFFSQVGPQVALVAPGVGVLSAVTLGGGAYSVVEVGGRAFSSRALMFAPTGEYSGKVLTCGVGSTRSSCGPEASCSGFIAYVDSGGRDPRGGSLTIDAKVSSVRRAGARAVIIGNSDPSQDMGDFWLSPEGRWVPTASVSKADGAAIKELQGSDATVRLVGVDYARFDGTSMAAPHVSGVAALVWSARPSLTAAQVRELLQESAEDLGQAGRDPTYGFGLVRAKAAMTLIESRYPANP
jgi:serine protease